MDRRAAVRDTYDRIADHFAATREHTWPEVESFLAELEADALPPDAVGLDLGCGNCRHADHLADRVDRAVGLDVSRGILETGRDRARERDFAVDLVQADAARLPLRSDAVEVAVYVATLHHLPSRAARIGSLAELGRVLAPDGRALVSAWSTEHGRFEPTEGFDTTVEWTLPDGETVDRFYHVYDPAEFAADLDRAGLTVADRTVSSGNCYAEVRS